MEKLCKQLTERFIGELKKEENRCIVEKDILDPITMYIGKRLYPYVIFACMVSCFALIVLCYIMFLIRCQNRQSQ